MQYHFKKLTKNFILLSVLTGVFFVLISGVKFQSLKSILTKMVLRTTVTNAKQGDLIVLYCVNSNNAELVVKGLQIDNAPITLTLENKTKVTLYGV